MRATARFAVDGDESIGLGVVRDNGVGDPFLEAMLEGFGFESDEQSANAIAGRNAVGKREDFAKPIRVAEGPAMNGSRSIAIAQNGAHGDCFASVESGRSLRSG